MRVKQASDEAKTVFESAERKARDEAEAKVTMAIANAEKKTAEAKQVSCEKVSEHKMATDLAVMNAQKAAKEIPALNQRVKAMADGKLASETAALEAREATKAVMTQKEDALGKTEAIAGTAESIEDAVAAASVASESSHSANSHAAVALQARADGDRAAVQVAKFAARADVN